MIPGSRYRYTPDIRFLFAERVKRETGMKTAAVGLLHSPDFCEEIIANGRTDLVVLGRTLLADPYWPLRGNKAPSEKLTLARAVRKGGHILNSPDGTAQETFSCFGEKKIDKKVTNPPNAIIAIANFHATGSLTLPN